MSTIIAIQIAPRWHDKAASHADVARLIDQRQPAAGSLVVLPEMFDVGFTMNVEVAVDDRVSDTRAFIGQLARRHGCHIIAGFAERDGAGRAVNQASYFTPDGERVASYIKCYGFSPAGEPGTYRAGDGPIVVDWAGLRVAPIICYDLRFSELFRDATRLGAEVFVVIANWGAARIDHWAALARARAIENQAYVVALNRCGSDPHLSYPGQSLIVDPKGIVVAQAGDGAEVLTAEIDAELIRGWRREFPALRDARWDARQDARGDVQQT